MLLYENNHILMKNFKKTKGFGKKTFGTRASFAAKKGFFSNNGRSNERDNEKYEAVCNECHKTCEVPFRPNGKKPVYCSNCFKGKEDTSRTYGPSRESGNRARPSFRNDRNETSEDGDNLKRQFTILNTKLDKLINVIETQNRLMSSSNK